MKIVQINATCGTGSIGKICQEVSTILTRRGIENYVLYSLGHSEHPNAIKYCNENIRKFQSLIEKVFGIYGHFAPFSTKKLIQQLDEIKPDIVHIHNIHSHDCDLTKLCDYFKSKQIKVFWTFHDCWAFTGYCPYFDMVDCSKWETQCQKCSLAKKYSLFFDKSSYNFEKKKRALSGLDLTIITPSQWLADLVKKSFLKASPVRVINNGINLSIFKPVASDFRVCFGLQDKKIILGVSYIWDKRKGIDTFIRLASDLNESYQIVLVGTNADVDKKLPKNIISIHKTENQEELVKIYTAADVFLIPTLEDNFPTVNIEALACGTPVITYATGGSPEIIDETCGLSVTKGDYESLKEAVINALRNPFASEACIKRASRFDKDDRYKEYINLYNLE